MLSAVNSCGSQACCSSAKDEVLFQLYVLWQLGLKIKRHILRVIISLIKFGLKTIGMFPFKLKTVICFGQRF